MTFFMVFQKKLENLILKFHEIWNSQRCSWVLWEYSQELEILGLNALA